MTDPLRDGAEPDEVPELYTVDDLARLLRTTPAAVRERVKRGGIPDDCVVDGLKPRRFRAVAVRRWLGLDAL